MRKMEEVWKKGMSEYYDKIQEEHVNMLSSKFNLDPALLHSELSSLKLHILNTLPNKSSTKSKPPKTSKKPPPSSTNGPYSSMSRTDIINLCSSRNLPRKRATQDMISSLLSYDSSHPPSSDPSSIPSSSNTSSNPSSDPISSNTSSDPSSSTHIPSSSTSVPPVTDNDSDDSDHEPHNNPPPFPFSDNEITEEDYI